MEIVVVSTCEAHAIVSWGQSVCNMSATGISDVLIEEPGVLIKGAGLIPNQNKHLMLEKTCAQHREVKPVLIPSSGTHTSIWNH